VNRILFLAENQSPQHNLLANARSQVAEEEAKEQAHVDISTPSVSVNGCNHHDINVESMPRSACQSNQCPGDIAQPKREPSKSGRQMKKIFPYHIVVDEVFDILQIGSSLPSTSILERDEKDLPSHHIADVLSISKPVLGSWDWESLKKLEDQTFFLDPIVSDSTHVSQCAFQGHDRSNIGSWRN
jgi:hypothetical protein